jgi:hypothetical protein
MPVSRAVQSKSWPPGSPPPEAALNRHRMISPVAEREKTSELHRIAQASARPS